ncbi:Spondin-1 [Chelonia mydas]|uniref:Spondin-1 n=1 Tax=Chelonia mydas TaxID=8469 RepID=M7BXQ0_CHEMY|nr:Spondin-1 [Chelonia mydas]
MYWPPLPAAPIGLEQRTAATGSRDRPNLRTQQSDEVLTVIKAKAQWPAWQPLNVTSDIRGTWSSLMCWSPFSSVTSPPIAHASSPESRKYSPSPQGLHHPYPVIKKIKRRRYILYYLHIQIMHRDNLPPVPDTRNRTKTLVWAPLDATSRTSSSTLALLWSMGYVQDTVSQTAHKTIADTPTLPFINHLLTT